MFFRLAMGLIALYFTSLVVLPITVASTAASVVEDSVITSTEVKTVEGLGIGIIIAILIGALMYFGVNIASTVFLVKLHGKCSKLESN